MGHREHTPFRGSLCAQLSLFPCFFVFCSDHPCYAQTTPLVNPGFHMHHSLAHTHTHCRPPSLHCGWNHHLHTCITCLSQSPRQNSFNSFAYVERFLHKLPLFVCFPPCAYAAYLFPAWGELPPERNHAFSRRLRLCHRRSVVPQLDFEFLLLIPPFCRHTTFDPPFSSGKAFFGDWSLICFSTKSGTVQIVQLHYL